MRSEQRHKNPDDPSSLSLACLPVGVINLPFNLQPFLHPFACKLLTGSASQPLFGHNVFWSSSEVSVLLHARHDQISSESL
ncbi:MAG: hypothetical protein EBS68_12895 [Rhodobacteraceae bacterium]|nr:hypothetical protein [Paracoccaceae bacterium]